ncbi:MAG TPA: hypothetical protein VJ830_08575, partial [Anaerolineales bacterium]|nr:hypothetical protein [Anaerolineales bacterium]
FGSIVGMGVSVGGGTVGVAVEGSNVGEGWNVAVGLNGSGWKGVGVGEAFGAAVTRVNGNAAWALLDGVKAPHPVRRYPASSRRWKHLFICYEMSTSRFGFELDVGKGVGVGGTGDDSVRGSRSVLRDKKWEAYRWEG